MNETHSPIQMCPSQQHESFPEERILWLAIINQRKKEAEEGDQYALKWFFHRDYDDDFTEICDYAMLNADYVRRKLKEKLGL